MVQAKEKFYQFLWYVVLVHLLRLPLGICLSILHEGTTEHELSPSEASNEFETTSGLCIVIIITTTIII